MSERPDRRPTAAAVAYERLKALVLRCELAPGRDLREGDLASALGLGRTPVREALTRLVLDGLVEVRPRQGYRVTSVTLGAVHEAFTIRGLLEPTAVELAAIRAGGRGANLPGLAELDCPPRAQTSTVGAITDDHDVHARLAELSGNRYLAKSVRMVLADVHRILVLGAGEADLVLEVEPFHHRICAAIREGDAQAARVAMEAEIAYTRSLVYDNLLRLLADVPLDRPRASVPGRGRTLSSFPPDL